MDSAPSGTTQRYTQVKVWIPPELAAAFKAMCLERNVSMSGAIAVFMRDSLAQPQPVKPVADPYATRRLRRKAVELIAEQLTGIMDAEQRYIDNIPDNLQSSRFHDTAELTVSALNEILNLLSEAY